MLNEVFSSFKDASEKSLLAFKKSLGKLRTGRAHASILDDIRVDYYGTPSPISQVATIAIPEPRTISIKPWEKNMVGAIEKAILASDLGITPNNNGEIILLSLPTLTGERRKALVKSAKKSGEDIKIALRSHRHNALDDLKMLEKEKEITEDDHKNGKEKIQDLINNFSKKVDDILKSKEDEIMTV